MRTVGLSMLVILAALAGCLGSEQADQTTPTAEPSTGEDQRLPGVRIETPHGSITLVLYPDIAPETVAQFTELVRTGWYNGSVFDRTVDNFVIQGGAPQEGQQPADPVPLEPGGYFAAGTLGMARDLEEGSGTSVFFITEYPQPHLRDPDARQSAAGVVYGEFTAFGQVVDGMDVVRAIAELPDDGDPSSDRPADPPEMTVWSVQVDLPEHRADELAYRTWGRELATPYRLSLDSPGKLLAGPSTWVRLFVEEQGEPALVPDLYPTIQITASGGQDVPVEVATLPVDPNVHRVQLEFPEPGDYELEVFDGVRPLASFSLTVDQA